MAIHRRPKADIVINEYLDERGRIIFPNEFHTIYTNKDFFKDWLDHRKLALAIEYTTGVRLKNIMKLKVSDFYDDFRYMKTTQVKPQKKLGYTICPFCDGKGYIGNTGENCNECKGKGKINDGTIHLRTQAKHVPIPNWLAKDLYYFMRHRIMCAVYLGEPSNDMRLFPQLTEAKMWNMFKKWRDRKGDKYPWLKDIWRIEKGYNKKHELLYETPHFRIANHAGRANYATAAYLITDKDIKAGQVISGHEDIENYARYVRVHDIMEKKEELKDKFMNPLCQVQPTPVSKQQKSLNKWFAET